LTSTKATHNAALQVVSGTTQEDLLLDGALLGSHSGGSAFAVVASGDVDERAIEHWLLEKRRASCGDSKEG
jgi:hypothetical protein